jgi:hypothetical protein
MYVWVEMSRGRFEVDGASRHRKVANLTLMRLLLYPLRKDVPWLSALNIVMLLMSLQLQYLALLL